MALIKDFTDASGVAHVAAHWRMVQCNICSAPLDIALTLYAYASFEAFATGKQPLTGGVKTYAVSGDEAQAVGLAAPVGSILYDVLANAAETFALSKLDTDSGTVDDQGNPVFVSFFDGATQV